MENFWIRDAAGRVVGPMDFGVLRDLVAANRIRGIAYVSRDGERWVTVGEDPDLAPLVSEQQRSSREQETTRRLRESTAGLQSLMPHQIFGIAPDAPAAAWRKGFFELVRRCYPESVPQSPSPELRQSLDDLTALLGRLMTFVEEKQRPGADRAAAGGLTPPPTATPTPIPGAPTSRTVEMRASMRFVRIVARPDGTRAAEFYLQKNDDGSLYGEVDVNADTYRIFTESKVTNLAGGGAFIPSQELVPMGTKVSLVFRFPDPNRVVSVQGKVVFWSAGDKGQPRGFGVRFTNLGLTDQAFMSAYVKKLQGGGRA
jgi:Tfp pilus assembly protein PilZ